MRELMLRAEARCAEVFRGMDDVALIGTKRVLDAFRREGVAARHFAPTTGYGYDDMGRDALERIFADVFGCEAAIVRPQITSGTQALALCLFGLLLPGDELLSATGRPYDTLDGVIGITGKTPGSLAEMGVTYREAQLDARGRMDIGAVLANMTDKTRVVAVQRSRGYSLRPSLMPEDIKPLSDMLKSRYPHAVLMVDNCYGEFVCEREPTHFGADICAGSLIKNPGGGLAPTGGYIAGRAALVERIAGRLTAPGMGREVGSYAASYRPFYQGLFMAPHTVSQALRIAALAAAALSEMGLKSTPAFDDRRGDIIQALELGTPERLIAFCRGIQAASPVDSMALPEPWDMPGYSDKVIMAAGTFVSGASIELSADGPMRPPYAAYLQGGLSYSHGFLALETALSGVSII